MKFLHLLTTALVTSLAVTAQTDSIFLSFPNSGINFEGLYANPTNGSAIVEDFNEDGRPDLLVMGPNYDDFTQWAYVNILMNNADGTFKRHKLNLSALNNSSMALLKVGPKKFILAAQGGTASPATNSNAKGYYTSIMWTGTGFSVSGTTQLNYGLINGSVVFVDVDADGDKDLITFGGGRKVYAYLNNNNSFTLDNTVTGLTGTVYGKVLVADADEDGKEDLLAIDQNSGLCVYRNNGDKTFTKTKLTSDYNFKIKPRMAIGDFNEDGHSDIVAFDTDANNGNQRVVFFKGDGKGGFTQLEENDLMGVDAAAVAVADFNHDGHLDILYSGQNKKVAQNDAPTTPTAKAYLLTGDGAFHFGVHVNATPAKVNPDIFYLSPTMNGDYLAADFDCDSIPDVFAIGELGIAIGGKIMHRSEMYLSSLEYEFGQPVEEPAVLPVWEGFPYSDVRLNGGPLLEAQEKHLKYIKSLDVNRLFASTIAYNLGDKSYKSYGGWEEDGYGASFAHYMSAVSMAYAATGDPELMQRLERCMEIVEGAQRYNGDGFFAFKDGTTWGFDKMARDKVITPYGWDENGNPWGNNDIGFPLYAHHKVLAGIRDVYRYTGMESARISFLKFCDWFCQWLQCFDDTNLQKMILSEHGGMVEVLTDAYAMSGKQKYLKAADRFMQKNFAEKMSANINDLQGRHSNFYCPIAVGASVNYMWTGLKRNQLIAKNFFDIVNNHHTLCNGGNGYNERFGTPDLLSYSLGMRGPETCSSYNMLKLAKNLFCLEGNASYIDYYENTLYNHILATLSPHDDAGVCYYMSLKPGTFRMYDNLYNDFWCCVGTGMESHVKYVDALWFHNDEDLLVSLFEPSTLRWKEKGLKATLSADYPTSDTITLCLDSCGSFSGKICLRVPSWAESGTLEVMVDGTPINLTAQPGELAEISGTWHNGSQLQFVLPARLHLVDLPDDLNVSAIFYGPVMLAANFGEVGQNDVGGSTPAEVIDNPSPDIYFPALEGSRSNLSSFLKRDAGTLSFHAVGQTKDYLLEPFYDTHHCRYNVYWQISDSIDRKQARELVSDYVVIGDSVSEQAHKLTTTGNSGTGAASYSFWGPTYYHYRNCNLTGSMSYEMQLLDHPLADGQKYWLQVTYFGSEPSGYGDFRIFVNGSQIAYQGSISYLAPLSFAQRYYAIPRNLTDGKEKITVKFGNGRASIYGLRLTTTDDLVRDKGKIAALTSPEAFSGDASHAIHAYGHRLVISSAPDDEVSVYNLNGQLVNRFNTSSATEERELSLASGLYMVTLSHQGQIIDSTKMFIE